MNGLPLLPALLIGLAGSAHCVGMCGGIISAFGIARKTPTPTATLRSFPVPVTTVAPRSAAHAAGGNLTRTLVYNSGRIASYATAGAIAGGLAGGIATLVDLHVVRQILYWAANGMLVALGLYLMGLWSGVARIEIIGKHLWSRLQPLLSTLLPLDTAPRLFFAGVLWGWLPCGMVYSMLLTAMLAGSASGAALQMAAFGVGTLPATLLIGFLGSRFADSRHQNTFRLIAGLLVLGFGLLGLLRAAQGMPDGLLGAICNTSLVFGDRP